MVINHNIGALNAQRNMGINSGAASKSMEKLSSGLKINRAGDNAAGLSISEKMRGQIRGLDQASTNSEDGISLIQTAEGALNETHSILQRMRELAVQAGNDTNASVDRDAIQKEINQLSSEINRIGNTTEFNTQKLLQGSNTADLDKTNIDIDSNIVASTAGTDATTSEVGINVKLKAGLANNDNITFQVNGKNLKVSYVTGTTAGIVDGNSVELGAAALAAGDENKVAKATAEVLQKLIDDDSSLKGNYKATVSGDSVTVEAIKGKEYEGSKGTMTVTANALTGIDSAKSKSSSGYTTTYTVNTTGAVQGVDTEATKASKTLSLNSVASNADALKLVGTGISINGEEIEFYNADQGTYKGKAIGIDISDVTNGTTLVDAIVKQTKNKLQNSELSIDTTDAYKLVIQSKEKGAASSVEVENGGTNKNYSVTFQVGANENQSMTVEIGDMRAEALGITNTKGGSKMTKQATVTDGTNNTNVEYALDVSDSKSAGNAISVIESALEKVSGQRSELGAYQNRLEHTINNLGTSSENLTAAESRIRDTDMASEMTNYSKNNILQQAAQAMLAQAKSTPENVLQLLR